MGYKQPKNTPMHNDGASLVGISAVIGALGKAAGIAVKGGKAVGKAVGKTGKVVGRAGKDVGKAVGKAGGAIGEKVGDAGKKVGKKVTEVSKKGAEKVSKITGESAEDTMKMFKQKAATGAVAAGTAGVGKAKEASSANVDASSYMTETNSEGKQERSLSGYSNPQGPSAYFNKDAGPSMRKGLKYDNCGASMSTDPVKGRSTTTSGVIKSNENTPALNPKNLRTEKKTVGGFLRGFDANVNVQGVNVNVGQVAQMLTGFGQVAGDKIKAKKLLKAKKSPVTSSKTSASRDSKQKKFSNIAQNIQGGPTKGNTKVDKVAKINRKNYLTGGIKPSYKKQ